MDEERQAFEYVEGKEEEAEEWAWANSEDGCPCSATEFCNSDGGVNIGFCEPCSWHETKESCKTDGLP